MSILSTSFSELHLLPHGITIEMVPKNKHSRYQLLLNEVHSNYCKRVGPFYANSLLDCFCAFLLEHFLTLLVTFSRLGKGCQAKIFQAKVI